MTYLAQLTDTPIAHALAIALLHFLWQGAAIGFAVALVLAGLSKATSRTRYGVAYSGLALMAVTFVGTVQFFLPAASVSDAHSIGFSTIPKISGTGGLSNLVFVSSGWETSAWLVPLWSLGVMIFCAYRIAGWFSARRLRLRGVCNAPDVWQQRLVELAMKIQLTRPVALLESSLADIPLALGLVKPTILIPLGLLTGLPRDQVEAILLHELAHIRRHEYLVNLLQSAVEGLLFYHPAVWWISRTIRQERELCCDDLAVAVTGNAPAFARALSALEQYRITESEPALAATGGQLMTRIQRLLGQPQSNPRFLSTAAPALGLLLLLSGGTLYAWQQPVEPSDVDALESRDAVDEMSSYVQEVAEQIRDSASLREDEGMMRDFESTLRFLDETMHRLQSGSVSREAEESLRKAGEALREAKESKKAGDLLGEEDGLSQEAEATLLAQNNSQTQAQTGLTAAQRSLGEERQRADQTYDRWLNEEVVWIVTDEERAAFESLGTDDERQLFIEQFWLRRDPTPDTSDNEAREEYYRRMAWANDRFQTADSPGWQTPRGRTYIRFGAPKSIDNNPGGEVWHYDSLPGIGQKVIIEFRN